MGHFLQQYRAYTVLLSALVRPGTRPARQSLLCNCPRVLVFGFP